MKAVSIAHLVVAAAGLLVLALIAPIPRAAAQTNANGGEHVKVVPGRDDSRGPVAVPGVTITRFGVLDGRILRGGEPSDEQLVELRRLGVRTVIAARTKPRAGMSERVEALGMQFLVIPMQRRKMPRDADVAAFLRAATDPARLPLFVFCNGGRHRSGALVAVYRIAVDGWSAEAALAEMRAYGFYDVLGLHSGFTRYVVSYERRMLADPCSVPVAYPRRAGAP